jgi:hypothetical protein
MVVSKMEITTQHGAINDKYQTKSVNIYSLDVVLAVRYRTNSLKAINFRKWATKVLKSYIQNGYVINSDKITNDRFISLENKVEQLSSKFDILESKQLKPTQGIFYDGQIFDAYSFISDIIREAKEKIILIDRFIIIDDKKIYHIGASLKDLGKKWFAFSNMDISLFDGMISKIES